MHKLLRQNRSFNNQIGFGEAYLFPVLIGLAICIYLLLPGLNALYDDGLTIPAMILGITGLLCSLWLATQLFGDYLNLSIIIVFAAIWITSDAWIISQFSTGTESIFSNPDFLQAAIPSGYFLIHAITLTIVKLITKDSNNH